MRNSNDQAPAISLPKGGGAIKGIGETFQPNLFSGTGNFSIPIYTSPGRNDFGPKLTLQYSTGNGNGPFGLGWQLSIPRITRKTEKGLPIYNEEDVFVMSGAEDLVLALDESGQPIEIPNPNFRIQRYRPRTEGLFARIEKWTNKEDKTTHWRAITKENVTSIYGKTNVAKIIHPDAETKSDPVYQWLLEETYDAKGNHIYYEYIKEDPNLGLSGLHERNRSYHQCYIRRILYGNTPDGLSAEKTVGPARDGTDPQNALATKKRHYLFELLFDYGDLPEELPAFTSIDGDEWWNQQDENLNGFPIREDPFSQFRAGFEIRTLRLCERVLMLHHFDEGDLLGAPLVKSTVFKYSYEIHAGFLQLDEVTLQGHRRDPDRPNSYLSRGMPAVTFQYSHFKPTKQRYQSVIADGNDLPPQALTDPNTALLDIYGRGIPDVVQSTAGGMHIWENRGNAQLSRRHPQHGNQPPVTLGQPNVSFGDMGGDGLADLIVDEPPMSGFYESTPDGQWRTIRRFDEMPSFNLADPNTRLVDLTGDGLSDVLVTRDQHFLWFRSKGEAGYENSIAISRQHDLDLFPDVYFSDPAGRVRLADMTGDGLNDIVLVHDGRIDYWPNLGYGHFGKRLTMEKTPRIGYDFDPRRLFLVDLDGTGCADLVYVDSDQVHFWFNRSGNSFSEKYTIKGTPFTVDTTGLQFADFFGTGTACLVWSYDAGTITGSNYKVLDFCGRTKPHLLIEMSNNMGATTRAEYASSTEFYLEDKKRGQPWVSNLPFPVQVLKKTEVIDHISRTKLVTTYKYHHGYYDGHEREFCGFGRVDQFDIEHFEEFSSSSLHEGEGLFDNGDKSFHCPPVETRTWFHTGIYYDADRNIDHRELTEQYQREYYQGDSSAFELSGHDFVLADGDIGPGAWPHEAHRALRGAQLRTEVYAHDGTVREAHPYLVTEERYRIQELQPGVGDAKPVYIALNRETVSYHYERNPADPRIGHTLNLDYDECGNVIRSVSIGYPRRPRSGEAESDDGSGNLPELEQQKLKATYTFSDFINTQNGEEEFYYASVPYQTRIFEVHGLEWAWPPANATEGIVEPLNAESFEGLDDPTDYEPFENDPPITPDGPLKRLVDWKKIYFRSDDDPLFIDEVGNLDHRLNLGEIEALGLPYETYQVAFTAAQLEAIFQGCQLDFDQLRDQGGYREEDGYFWVPSGRQGFDPTKFFAVISAADAFGKKTTTVLDDYALLTTEVRDALLPPQTNIYQAKNDYRVLQPWESTDPNGSKNQVAYDAMGLVVGTAVFGFDVDGNRVGDSLDGFIADLSSDQIINHIDDPLNLDSEYDTEPHNVLKDASSRLLYDLNRYRRIGKPNVVYTLARETHVSDEHGIPSKIQHSFVYSDGFGREAQTKVQAEPGRIEDGDEIISPRWVGTGTKVFNNKGKPVRQYEPFFSKDHLFGIELQGVSPTLFYDPLERVVCTLHPNHTYEKVVFDPWRERRWDANDTIHPDHRYDPDQKPVFIPIEPPGSTTACAIDVNDRGQISGYYRDFEGTYHSFLLDSGVFTTLHYPGAPHDSGGGINNHGTIVGRYHGTDDRVHGYRLEDGIYSEIHFPNAAHTLPRTLNDAGLVVGYYDATPDLSASRHGFLFDGNQYQTIEPLGATLSLANDINNAGTIVGSYRGPDGVIRGFVRVGEEFTTIDIPDAVESWASSINDLGHIVGGYTDTIGITRSYLLVDNKRTDIQHHDARNTACHGINNTGVMVGMITNNNYVVLQAFELYLGDLIYSGFSPDMDTDVGHFFRELPDDDYLPTWYNAQVAGNAAETRAAKLASRHSATPTTVHLDVFGRNFLTIEDNGPEAADKLRTWVELDIEGNDRRIIDPRNIPLFEHHFDIAGRKLGVDSKDAGDKRILLAVDNQPLWTWDARGHKVEIEYDALRRPRATWVTGPSTDGNRILAQATVYGEHLVINAGPEAATKGHHRGRPYLTLDGAGVVFNWNYDFKGNAIEVRRVLISGNEDVSDWQNLNLSHPIEEILRQLQETPLLEREVFIATSEFDALNRVVRSFAPDHSPRTGPDDDNPTDGSVYRYTFNEANLLDKVEVDLRAERGDNGGFRTFVNNNVYNARGQRTSIQYGNGVNTEYIYDSDTFRLKLLKTNRANGDRLQDLRYVYDPVGNITEIRDDAIATVWHDQQRIDGVCRYEYDPNYHLISASGREHKAMGAAQYRKPDAFKQSLYHRIPPPTTDTQALQMYTENYTYDPSGNLQEIKHCRGTSSVLWKREQTYAIDSNRILTSGAAADDPDRGDLVANYTHDKNGNFKILPHLKNGGQANAQNLFWDYGDRLVRAELNLNGNVAHYIYDATGQRVRKRIIKGNVCEERIYLGDFEIYRKYEGRGASALERQTLHVMDDKNRVAMVEHKTKGPANGEAQTRFRYQLANHLGSSVMEVDETEQANVISYEEYYPYGGTSYIGGRAAQRDEKIASSKCYRYSGKERDDETGLYYYGARYYAPWLGRWTAVDPTGMVDGTGVYGY